MRPDTKLLGFKLACYMGAAMFLQLVSALAQWAGGDGEPNTIQWIIIVCTTLAALCNAGLSFFSSSWAEWKTSRNGSFSGPGTPPEPPTNQPPKTP